MSLINDIRHEYREVPLSRTQLLQFAALWIIVFAFLAWSLIRVDNEKNSTVFLFLSLAIFTIALARVTFLIPFYKAWMMIATILGWFSSRLLLSAIFFIIITPTALIARVFGKQFLDYSSDKNTYWVNRDNRSFHHDKPY